MAVPSALEHRKVSLCEVLDRVLHKGAVISGEVGISVADIELIRLALNLVIASSGTFLAIEEKEEEHGNPGAR